jgi:hypothetical protein
MKTDLRTLLVGLGLLAVIAGVDAFLIEPDWIEVTHHRVMAPLSSPLKIAHLTDIHAQGLGRREQRMIAILRDERPDLIAITGDSIFGADLMQVFQKAIGLSTPDVVDDSSTEPYDKGYAGCLEVLQQLHAPLGIWFVRGNWEHWHPIVDERKFSEVAGVHLLQNAASQVSEGVWILGLDDGVVGSPDFEAALRGVPSDAFKIVLFHSPSYFRKVAGRCDLALAGHTHGGQVYLPPLTRLWLPPGCGKFLAGWYEKQGSRMYVSRGIGTSTLSVRFLCRPELAIITVGR